MEHRLLKTKMREVGVKLVDFFDSTLDSTRLTRLWTHSWKLCEADDEYGMIAAAVSRKRQVNSDVNSKAMDQIQATTTETLKETITFGSLDHFLIHQATLH
jgi:hypothetical protein